MNSQEINYLIIGDGRMAKHLGHYFGLLNLPYQNWSRSKNNLGELNKKLSESTHVLLAISDSHIDTFINDHLSELSSLMKIHFSGSLVTENAYSAHPPQSFTQELYSLEDYQKIPFIIEENSPSFEKLLPGLSNPHYRIPPREKPYYHALCVMANNFTTLLWQKFFDEMQSRFKIKHQDLLPYLNQTLNNLKKDPQSALTGPISRKDISTLKKNLNALTEDNFYRIYQAFSETFVPEILDEIHS